jgi:hypothetical protein
MDHTLYMNDATTQTTTESLADLYNAGLERGRRQQTMGRGYLIPSRIQYLGEAQQAAYEAGWTAGFEKTTRLELLRRR